MLSFHIGKRSLVKAVILIFLGIVLSLKVDAQPNHELNLFDFAKDYPTGCEDPRDPCYSMNHLIERALEFGMDSQEEIQLLFQAYATARIKMGLLLPQMDPINAASAAMEGKIGLDTATLFVGFLSPS